MIVFLKVLFVIVGVPLGFLMTVGSGNKFAGLMGLVMMCAAIAQVFDFRAMYVLVAAFILGGLADFLIPGFRGGWH